MITFNTYEIPCSTYVFDCFFFYLKKILEQLQTFFEVNRKFLVRNDIFGTYRIEFILFSIFKTKKGIQFINIPASFIYSYFSHALLFCIVCLLLHSYLFFFIYQCTSIYVNILQLIHISKNNSVCPIILIINIDSMHKYFKYFYNLIQPVYYIQIIYIVVYIQDHLYIIIAMILLEYYTICIIYLRKLSIYHA